MIGNDRFVQVFGSVPAGDDTLLTQIVSNAVREGFHIVLCEPGTSTPMCTLPASRAKHDHECGVAHVLSLESLLGGMDPWGEMMGYTPKEKAKVRAKVSALINRVTKVRDGVKPNIAVIPGPSGYVVVTEPKDTRFPTIWAESWDFRWYWFTLPDGELRAKVNQPILVPPSTLGRRRLQMIGQTSPAPEWLLERITAA